TSCARSASRRSVGSIRRSWSACSWTGPGSRWRSAATRATRPRRRRSCRSSSSSKPAGLADMAVVADAGMLSMEYLNAIDEAGLRFIVGSRPKKSPGDLANHFHWHGDAFTDGQLIDTITPRHGNTRTETKRLRREPVWDAEEYPGHWRAVWAFSRKRA